MSMTSNSLKIDSNSAVHLRSISSCRSDISQLFAALLFNEGTAVAQLVEALRYKSEGRQLFAALLFNERTAVAQLVEALRYKSEGRGFDSRWCHWNFSLT